MRGIIKGMVIGIVLCLVIVVLVVFQFRHEQALTIPTKTVVASEAKGFLVKTVASESNISDTTNKKEEVSSSKTVTVFHGDLNRTREQLKKKLEEEQQKQ
jgi:hypothetical protein